MVAVVSGYLLDTNVISELMKPRPARAVAAWIVSTPENLMHLSVITIGEIRKGIELLDEDEPKRSALQSWLDHDLRVTRNTAHVRSIKVPVFNPWNG